MTLDWTDNLLRAEKGDKCIFCSRSNPAGNRGIGPGDVRYVSTGPDEGFPACRECLSDIADAINAARPRKTRHLCPKCGGYGVKPLVNFKESTRKWVEEPCEVCKGKRLVVIKVKGPLEVLEAVPSPDESPVAPGQEDPA